MVETGPRGKKIVIGANLNGHVGQGNKEDKEVLGRYSVMKKNPKEKMVMTLQKNEFRCCEHLFSKKRRASRFTKKVKGHLMDYILWSKSNLKKI